MRGKEINCESLTNNYFNNIFLNYINKSSDRNNEHLFTLLNDKNWMKLYPLQPFPIFLDKSDIDELVKISTVIVKIIQEIPQKHFNNNSADIAKFYNILGGESWADLMLDTPNGILQAIYRPDLIFTSNGIKCIEINGGNAGGWIVSSLTPLYQEVPIINKFIQKNSLKIHYSNTISILFMHILNQLKSKFNSSINEELNIAISVSADHLNEFNFTSNNILQHEYQIALQKIFPEKSGQVIFCQFNELDIKNTEVSCNKIKIHALIEDFVEDCPNRMKTFRAFKKNMIDLYTGPVSLLLNDKRNIVLLSDHLKLTFLTQEQRTLLDSCIPWTRSVTANYTTYKYNNIFIPEFISINRESFVLKHANSHGGHHVYIGNSCSQNSWDNIITEALNDGNWIAQEYLQSKSYTLQSRAGDLTEHDVIWGPFIIGGKYAGGFARTLPRTGYTPSTNVQNTELFTINSMINSLNADSNVDILPIMSLESN